MTRKSNAWKRIGSQSLAMKLFRAAIIAAAFVAIGALSRADPAPTVHYAPAENLEHIDVSLIDGARHEIDFAAANLTIAIRDTREGGIDFLITMDTETAL
jgi:hypothetical protein